MLEVKNVTKKFGGFTALDNLSMTVPKGSVYGLVGPNGAGKSTILRSVTGIYRVDEGEITLDGAPVFENPAAKARIGFIGDEVFYFPSSTLEDMHQFYKGMYPGYDDYLFSELQGVFQLPLNGQIRRFSKGMQKQAAFHLTLCAHPELLVLDEPVDGLDPVMRRQVMSLILSSVAEHGTTVLISSHNLRELEDVCDHVGIMDHGKMLLQRNLSEMQGSILKLMIAGDVPQGLDILHESTAGRLKTLIVKGSEEEITQKVQTVNPAYYDLLPLSLEEIFIYELGGVNYEVKNIVL